MASPLHSIEELMLGNISLRWFLLVFLLVTVFCSSCYLTKSKDQWSYTKQDLERQILKKPNDYDANYKLGIAYATRQDLERQMLKNSNACCLELRLSSPYNWKKFFFRKAILYLKEAIRIKPESAAAHLALGKVLGNQIINDGFGAIRHTVISKKLFERQNNTEGAARAEVNIQVLSKKFFSFALLGFSDIKIPEPLQLSSLALPPAAKAPTQVE
jgi:hypothetical protein